MKDSKIKRYLAWFDMGIISYNELQNWLDYRIRMCESRVAIARSK